MQTRKWTVPIAVFFSVSLGLPLALRFAASRSDAPAISAAAQRTLALYDRTAELLEAGRDAEAVALLQEAAGQPVEMPDSADLESVSRDLSSAARMIVLGRMLCARAMQEVRAGDPQEAQGWVMRVRQLSAQALATPSPTLQAFLTGRALDSQAGRVEMALAKRVASPDVCERIVHSEEVLRAFYEREMLPRILAARKQRDEERNRATRRYADAGKQAEALEQVNRFMNKSDAVLAASLLRRYASQRAQVQANRFVPGRRAHLSRASSSSVRSTAAFAAPI